MKLHKLFLANTFLLFTSIASGTMHGNLRKIVTTQNDREVESLLKDEADKDTLVLFDCDDVLTIPKEDALSYKNFDTTLAYSEEYLYGKKESVIESFYDKVKKDIRDLRLLNENWLNIITEMQDADTKVAMLTAHQTGEYEGQQHYENMRKDELAVLGVDFKQSWPIHEQVTLLFDDRNPALFDDGIIFSCSFSKGRVLEKFLRYWRDNHNGNFSKIIFVDDNRDNIESVYRTCAFMGISYLGIEYRKVEALPTIDYDKVVEYVQNTMAEIIDE